MKQMRGRSNSALSAVLFFFLVYITGDITLSARAEAQPTDPFEEQRQRMVKEDIGSSGFWDAREPVRDEKVLEVMRMVPRHEFVPEKLRDESYEDTPLPIGHGQTISQPYMVAYMTAMLGANADDIALEVGTGSGYQAAVLSRIVKEVYSIEIIPELEAGARRALEKLGYANVHTRSGDGYRGWGEHGPFDVIIVTAAASHIPPPLVEQLKPGGRMAIPVGPPGQVQQLMLVEKREDGKITQRSVMPVQFVPLTRAAR